MSETELEWEWNDISRVYQTLVEDPEDDSWWMTIKVDEHRVRLKSYGNSTCGEVELTTEEVFEIVAKIQELRAKRGG